MPKKAERNVDKIKRLEKELAAEREKRHHADIEIVRMHKIVNSVREEAVLQALDVSKLVDGAIAALAIQFGERIGQAWELRLPVYSPADLCEKFVVVGDRDNSSKNYVFRVEGRGTINDNQ